MLEDGSFDEFYSNPNDIVNFKFNLGEKVEDLKVVRKILIFLPETFHPKVTDIEESKDLHEIKVEELVGSLQIYELLLPQIKKRKFIAIKTVKEDQNCSSNEEDGLNNEDLDLIARKYFL